MSNYSASNETKHVQIILLKTKHMQVAYMQKLRSCEIRGTKCITHRIFILWMSDKIIVKLKVYSSPNTLENFDKMLSGARVHFYKVFS